MTKLTREKLERLREELNTQKSNDKTITILIGMGTCGIAAGAEDTFRKFVEVIEKKGIKNIRVKPTGCMGYCYVEPTVEIIMQDMPQTLYGKISSEIVERLVEEHIIKKQLLNNFLFDKPAIDIMR